METTLKATIENIDVVREAINEYLETNGCSMQFIMQFDVVLDEILSNIVHYAYDGEGDMTVKYDYDAPSSLLTASFVDGGIAYNPLEKEDPDVTLSAEERQPGGLGIFLVKKMTDSVSYERKGDKNILTITKKN